MNDAVLEARSLAGNKFKNGLNCSEAIVHAFNEILNKPLNSEALKMATGFGGGGRACRLYVWSLDGLSYDSGTL